MVLQKELCGEQQQDPGDAQEAHHQRRDEVDGEDDARESGDQVQQPQADKAGEGVDAELPDQLHLGQAEPEKQKDQRGGDQNREKIFHRGLRIKSRAAGQDSIGQENGLMNES